MDNLEYIILPALADNYIYLLFNRKSKTCLIVDPGIADPVIDFIETQGFQRPNEFFGQEEGSSVQKITIAGILLTHHHDDHIAGALGLKVLYQCPIYAPLKNRDQIPFADFYVSEGDLIQQDEFQFVVWEVPGHTLGHICYWEVSQKWMFCGDTLFGLGCGRLFEGTAEQMFTSLQRIAGLPSQTLLFCSHEYTQANLQFSLQEVSSIEYGFLSRWITRRREALLPTVPTTIERELTYNLFLRAQTVEEFAQLRHRRNIFVGSITLP